jgi:circadian clock protein KaiC
MTRPGGHPRFRRNETGIPGLDTLLQGGLSAGSVFIVQGPPGAGKTILANQVCFHHAKRGGKALYLTLLAEAHDRLLWLMKEMSFFDSAQVPSNIYYVSGFDTLQDKGLDGILHLLTSEMTRFGADLLIIDGLFVLEEFAASDVSFRKFINQLSTWANLSELSVMLLTNSRGLRPGPEHTMVDGWIDLGIDTLDYRSIRDIQIRKYRGSDFISGRHALRIGDDGITVFPRLEATVGTNPAPGVVTGRLASGIDELDAMVGGGFPRASSTLVLGATGVGKTTLALHFISRSSAAEPGHFFAFYETAERLRLRADRLTLAFGAACDQGFAEVSWHAPLEQRLDKLGYEIIDAVKRRGMRRLVVDGVDSLALSMIHPQRLAPFLTALTNELRDQDVTTIYSLKLARLMSGSAAISIGALSAVAENVIFLRYQERKGRLQRLISVLKVGESAFDDSIREFAITNTGIKIGDAAGYVGGSTANTPDTGLPWETSHE